MDLLESQEAPAAVVVVVAHWREAVSLFSASQIGIVTCDPWP